MLHHNDSEIRLQLAQEHADWLTDEMRRSRGLTPDEVGYPGWARLGSALAGRVERLLPTQARSGVPGVRLLQPRAGYVRRAAVYCAPRRARCSRTT
jgi:hypothetical protein